MILIGLPVRHLRLGSRRLRQEKKPLVTRIFRKEHSGVGISIVALSTESGASCDASGET